MSSRSTRVRWYIGGAAALAVLVGFAMAFAYSAWSEVNRVSIERPVGEATAAPESQEEQEEKESRPSESVEEDGPGVVAISGGLDIYLLVGSDSRADLDSLEGFGDFEGTRADVVMLFLRTDTEAAVMSLPRDLYVEDLCNGGQARLSNMLEDCETEMNGPTHLTVSIENLIGETVDHFAMVDLAGFQSAVDAVGGYEICVENPVRDSKARLDLPAGCTQATGEQALAWLRSRQTQELTADGWRIIPGMNDLARNERQRAFLIDMMSRLGDFSSPQAMAATAQAVAPYVTVDSELTLAGAVDLAWSLRGLGSGSLTEIDVPVYDHVTDAGAAVLLPSTPVDQIMAGFLASEVADASTLLATG